MEKKIEISIHEYPGIDELNEEDRILVHEAMEASTTAYSPYSDFSVGAAVRLNTGELIRGSNRENAAFPSGICAERTAIAWAGASYPDSHIISIAIAASTNKGFTSDPVSPCGSCRQVIAEEEDRSDVSIRIILFGESKVQVIEGNKNLLPLHFNALYLKAAD